MVEQNMNQNLFSTFHFKMNRRKCILFTSYVGKHLQPYVVMNRITTDPRSILVSLINFAMIPLHRNAEMMDE